MGRDPRTGKKVQKWIGGLKTLREAQAKRAQVLVDLQAGTWTAPTRLSTGEYLERWLQDYAKGACGPVTLRGYEAIIRRHVIPALGHIPLARLGPQAIQRYYSEVLAREVKREGGMRPVTTTTVHAHHRLLRTALGHAVRWGHIARNPASMTNPPRPARRKVTVWDSEQVRLFLGEARRTSRYHALYLTALLMGMRQGELLGLRWQDVDFPTRTATIRQTYYRLGRERFFKSPKTTGSERAVHLPEAVVTALQQVRGDQQEAKRFLGDGYAHDLDLVFCQPNGQPHNAHNLTQRDFRRIQQQAGLPLVRFHDLRHAHASYLALAGVSPKVAQERLGHATPDFTMRVYTHTLAGAQEKAAADVEAYLLGRAESQPEPDGIAS